ncbi:MAG: PilW family protein [Thiohalomonadaceae bacterium]
MLILNKTLRFQQGLTIVEMLVAMAISLILLAGVAQIFLSNRDSFRLQEGMAYVQENGRFAIEFMTRDVRMVGFMGCRAETVVNNVDPSKGNDAAKLGLGDPGSGAFDGSNSLIGYRYGGGALPADLVTYGLLAPAEPRTGRMVVPGTDVIVVKRADSCPGGDVISRDINNARYAIRSNEFCNIQQNDIVMITDCQNADVHGVTNVVGQTNIAHGANLNLTPMLSGGYGPGSMVMKMRAAIYYIGYGTSGEPALYRCVISGIDDTCANALSREELVEGVYGMDILYGVDTDGASAAGSLVPRRYVGADDVAVGEWDSVAAARLTFRVRSRQDNIVRDPQTYSYQAANVTDRRLRKDFSTTVAVRNRVQ